MPDKTSNMRDDAIKILKAAIAAVDPENAVKSFLSFSNNTLSAGDEKYNLNEYHRVVVVGAGKASAPMAKAVESILGDRINKGTVVIKYGYGMLLDRIELIEAGHPVPDENGLAGTQKIADLLDACTENDLIISLI